MREENAAPPSDRGLRKTVIKGIYVAQVRIDIAVDENSPGLLPFDQMQKALREQTTEAVKDLLEDELFGDVGTVTVEQQMADLWETEDG